ncbi:right-handed parallel beta-helix repeat-containing protein [Amylibacter sp.]|nr:right-handed parallel beta-helix repeat-containing protein [Amylibacter sp.]
MNKIVLDTCLFVCALILQVLNVHAAPVNMSDQEFTALTGLYVEDAFCDQSHDDEYLNNWMEKVAKIQLRVNVEKYTADLVKKIMKPVTISSNKQKYRKIKIKLNGTDCWISGKYRLTGDLYDHVGVKREILHSIKVKITDGRIDNILKFKLLAPKTRSGKLEVLNYVIHKKLGLLAPRTSLVEVQIGGQTYEAIFQEDVNEQLLEHNNLHEAILLEADEGYFPFATPRIINKNLTKNAHFRDISMYALEKIGQVFQSTSKYNMETRIDNPIFLDFIPEKSRNEFIYFHLLNFSLNSAGGLTTDDSRFVFDHISRRYRPIYYDGHATGTTSKVSDLNFDIPDDIQFRLLEDLKSLNLIKLESDLNDLGAQFSIKELQKILNDAINFIKAAKGKKTSIKPVKTSKVLIDYEQIEKTSKQLIKNKNISSLQVSWIINETELEKCVYHKNKKKCNKESLNENQKLIYQKEIRSLSQGVFLHGLSSESLVTPYFQELAFNTLTLLGTGTIIEHTNNLELSVNEDAKTITVASNNKSASTSQIRVSGGVLDDWEFVVKKGVFLGYKKQAGTRASKFGLTGCITFNDLNVKSLKVHIQDSMCEDAIHFVRTKGHIESVTVINTLADAIDADFSDLTFDNLDIFEAGNDCVDFSAGTYQISKNKFYNCGDKGVSVGEGSSVVLNNSEIRGALIGIVSKDGSSVVIKEARLLNVDVCLAVYKKKQEYGTARIVREDINCDSEKYFQQNGSHLNY